MSEYTLPSNRLASWVPGTDVGVPGGIDQYRVGGASQRTNLIDVTQAPYNADNTGSTDATSAVQAAINAATSGQVVYLPAGTYRFNTQVDIGYKDNITIRGAGPTQTIINFYGSTGSAINVGGDANYEWNYPNLTITGSPTKGTSVLSIADTTNVTVGAVSQIALQNSSDATVPVVSVAGFQYMRRQKVMVTAKTATTITISPALYFDLPSSLTPKLQQASLQCENVGVEDLSISLTNSSTPHAGIRMQQSYGCWLYNVKITGVPNYNFMVSDSVKCEIRKCDGHGRQIEGTNGAALLTGTAGACLFEDNIFGENFPIIEVNGGTAGCVIAYNFMYDSAVFGGSGAAIDTNHGPHNSYNIYEGNIAPNVQCDGYFGGASEDTFFRNWLHGVADTGIRGLTANFNRFTRNYSMVGNILGENTSTSFIYPDGSAAWGMPNIGNFSWTGTAQPSVGDWWADFGTSPGPGGFQELDLDVEATLILKGNYNTENDAIPAGESLSGQTLANSWFRTSKPSWFGNLSWPPFSSESPFTPILNDANISRIPAGYRYVNGQDPPADNTLKAKAFNVKKIVGMRKIIFGTLIGFLGLILFR